MFRLFGTAALLAVLILFIGLNLNNRCDVSFWFSEGAVFRQVPVYLTVFISFVLGLLCSVPLAFSLRRSRKPKAQPKAPEQTGAAGGKKKKGESEIKDINDGSYGID